METRIIREKLSEAAELLKRGELVAVPTETVYGLAGNGLNEEVVKEIYEVKGRPAIKPLSLMVSDAEAMDKYCEDVPEAAKKLAERFWPGPLTIVLKSGDAVPDIVRAGGSTVGLRCPDHPMTLEALRLADIPFAAPSANPSGEPSPKNAQQVMKYFDGKISAVIDGGECGIGTESTIIDMSGRPYRILRQGALDREKIAQVLADNVKVIGITGGTGCGKTTALNELKKMGALVIDCDAVYHRLLSESTEMMTELKEHFPAAFANGVFDRKALGAIVFNDAKALEALNAITHSYVIMETERLLCDFAMEGGTLAAIDAIELISSGISKLCRATVAVLAASETRISRIMARDNISREYAEMRVMAQKPDSYFIDNCTYTIRNDSDIKKFANEFHKMIQEVIN